MSAILSTDDLNDFISPGAACIKPVELLPEPSPLISNYEVTTEDGAQESQSTAQISLTDCLACSGCVTSAEAVLVSLQSHAEVLKALDTFPPFQFDEQSEQSGMRPDDPSSKIFIATVSQQVRASIAATYDVSEETAGSMIANLLCGTEGLGSGGTYNNRFTWAIDINPFRDLALAIGAREALEATESGTSGRTTGRLPTARDLPRLPILTSVCPGWICYAEKTHPHILPHLSRAKSPQALAGTLLKSVLAKHYGIEPSRIWHLSIMPCFDKKLEASRQELTNKTWRSSESVSSPVRDVDCVITAREILMLADSRGVSFPRLIENHGSSNRFPDPFFEKFLFPQRQRTWWKDPLASTSGGYLYQIASLHEAASSKNALKTLPGRNSDMIEYVVESNGLTVFKGARYYGFRNIQNLVRKLKPVRTRLQSASNSTKSSPAKAIPLNRLDSTYVEVMACPGGCTNGGGQIKVADLSDLQSPVAGKIGQKEWQKKVDKAYFAIKAHEPDDLDNNGGIDNFSSLATFLDDAKKLLDYWSEMTGIPESNLIFTTYRQVESDVGQPKQGVEKVAALASKIGGGW